MTRRLTVWMQHPRWLRRVPVAMVTVQHQHHRYIYTTCRFFPYITSLRLTLFYKHGNPVIWFDPSSTHDLHPFRTWLVLHAGVCSHACRRSSCVSVVTTSPRRGDPVDGEPWCCCARVDARFSPVQPKMVAVHASAHSVASSEWIICLDKRWETPRPNAIFTCVQFIVRRGCNKVTAVCVPDASPTSEQASCS